MMQPAQKFIFTIEQKRSALRHRSRRLSWALESRDVDLQIKAVFLGDAGVSQGKRNGMCEIALHKSLMVPKLMSRPALPKNLSAGFFCQLLRQRQIEHPVQRHFRLDSLDVEGLLISSAVNITPRRNNAESHRTAAVTPSISIHFAMILTVSALFLWMNSLASVSARIICLISWR